MRERTVRVMLALLAASGAVVGVWATFAPRSFYDSFPGGGRSWVAVDGPYNQHLVSDVGGLNLALALLAAVAAVRLLPVLVRTAAVASILYGLPHFLYHATHLDPYDTSDKVANVVTLGLGVVLGLAVLLLSVARAPGTSGRIGQDRVPVGPNP